MCRFFQPWSLAICFPILVGSVARADADMDQKWKDVRDHQPPGLHLKMTLPKDHFFQGEEIDATLEFSNDDTTAKYSLEVGYTPCAIFHADNEKGQPVIDPVRWIHTWFNSDFGGMIGFHDLGEYTCTLPANENVRFDQPGIYSLYASATLNRSDSPAHNTGAVDIVSDPVAITITPITSDQEQQVIAGAIPMISTVDSPSGLDESTRKGINELKYLQTPSARAELTKLMIRPQLVEPAAWGLEASPDPAAEAGHLLDAVRTGNLVLGPYGVTIYAELKAGRLVQLITLPPDLGNPDVQKRLSEMRTIMEQARQEITAAMVQSTGNEKGTAHAEALWTAFEEVASSRGMPDERFPDGGAAQRAVAEHQLELSDATVKRLLTSWTSYGGPEFLPVVRREVAKRSENPNALIALCTIKPDEARPLVLAEMVRPDSNFFKGSYVPVTLLSVSPMPLPELDDFFRTKLTDPNQPPGQILSLVACFGSTALLPPVLDLNRHHGAAYPWGPDAWVPLYFYWMRCDAPAAIADFEPFFKSNPENCWAFLNNAFIFDHGSDTALPLLHVVLKSDNASLASGAIDRLLQRGSDADIEPMLEAMERLQKDKTYGKWLRTDAQTILASDRWHLTSNQKKRLEALAATP
jgi:hypothetical protein